MYDRGEQKRDERRREKRGDELYLTLSKGNRHAYLGVNNKVEWEAEVDKYQEIVFIINIGLQQNDTVFFKVCPLLFFSLSFLAR